jgi:hypothetical protein
MGCNIWGRITLVPFSLSLAPWGYEKAGDTVNGAEGKREKPLAHCRPQNTEMHNVPYCPLDVQLRRKTTKCWGVLHTKLLVSTLKQHFEKDSVKLL